MSETCFYMCVVGQHAEKEVVADNYRNPFVGGQTSARPTEKVLETCGCIVLTGGQDLKWVLP